MFRTLLKMHGLLTVLLCISMTAFAQRTISGKVSSSDDKTGMPGVSIAEKGTANGTVSDATGSYTITASDNATLVFSFVGYQTLEVAVGAQTTLDVVLVPDIRELGEIVVTGYSSQAKRDLTGAVSTVSPEVIAKSPTQDIGTALKGRVAGVSVDEQGGPGSPAVVRIRGFGTLGNNDPLYVVDGVQMRGSNVLINPNNIETLSVMKDPSITSLYGAQGGNGVIVITTKTGKKGAPKLEYNAYIGSEQPIKYPTVLTPQEYADSYWGYLSNSGLPLSGQFYGSGATPVLPDYIIETTSGNPTVVNEGDPAANPSLYNINNYRILKTNKQGTNWFKEILKPAFTQNHQLSLSGANDVSNYAVTFGYADNKGIVLGTYFKRYSLRANTLFKIKPWLRVGETMEFSYSEGGGLNNHDPNNVMADLYKRSPLMPMYDIAGNYSGPKGITDALEFHPGGNNPVMGQNTGRQNYSGFNSGAIGSAYLEAEPIKGLVYSSKIGVQLYPYQYHYFYDTYPQNIYSSIYNSFTEGGGYTSDWRWTNKLSYDLEIKQIHKISAFVAYESRQLVSRSNSATTPNLPYTSPSNRYLGNGVPIPTSGLFNTVGGGGDIATSTSIFGNVNYSLLDRYLLSAVLRRDGSSKFGSLSRYGTFPSISAGWRISGERFMEDITWVNELKIRAAVGSNGNDAIGSGGAVNQYSINTYTSSYDLGGNNNSASTGLGLYSIGNPRVQWEANRTTNLGFDATLFSNKLSVSFNAFNRTTDKLLYAPPVTGIQGDALAPVQNVMKFANKGVELELGYNSPDKGDAFRYEMNFNIATYRNEVLYISSDTAAFILGSNYFPTHFSMNRSQVGKPVASFYGYVQEGIFQTAADVENHATQTGIDKATPDTGLGHFMFKDINGDGKIDESDRTIIGNPHPKFTFGYNVNFYYKKFDLGIFIEGTYGNKIFNYWRAFTKWPGANGTGSTDTWSPTNTGASLPIWSVSGAPDNAPSTFFIEDGSYVRIKNLQLGYTLPNMKAFSRFRVYVQAYNIATFTKYTGIDPQIATGSPGSVGVDYGGNYPISRKILFGLNIGL